MEPDPHLTVAQGIDRLLERVALSSTSGGAEVSRNRVTLLTLHSTKGLEFSRVYVVGVEDYHRRLKEDHAFAGSGYIIGAHHDER